MDDIERDPKLREKINLFKDEENIKKLSEKELARKAQLSKRLKRRMLKVVSVKVKDPKEMILQQEQELQEKLKLAEERRAERELQKQANEDDDDYNHNEVKLAELLDELKIDEQAANENEDTNKIYDDDNFIDEFVKRLDHIKIEK